LVEEAPVTPLPMTMTLLEAQKKWINDKHLKVLSDASAGRREHEEYWRYRSLLKLPALELLITDVKITSVCLNVPVWPAAFQAVMTHGYTQDYKWTTWQYLGVVAHIEHAELQYNKRNRPPRSKFESYILMLEQLKWIREALVEHPVMRLKK
jgi:hypothetical protein